ncbi:hypothetical protein C5B42_05720 [Candidatus Cerribacteria bacterium 'Amazon FNV 2010 28 9']|uniref:LysM domain-containing protein n=1 Tax=Candidatus Cerribacteria bacterium 'Amazon FNV 2010 28 9' TaxID=2081795 RepID=A0A317JS44_9BACT|nr:MAG: hypothetical protein C5B42_05720 [Candidatus Cerribacteria bacterium 'Amazon FNV 2010 28 9']
MTSDKPTTAQELSHFFQWARWYGKTRIYTLFSRFEWVKDSAVNPLYKRRGKYARPILHTLTLALLFFGITLGPLIVRNNAEAQNSDATPSSVLMNSSGQDLGGGINTLEGEDVLKYRGGEIYNYTVVSGDTLQSIANKYNLHDIHTITWLNNIGEKDALKPGQVLKILPVDGVLHKVQKGDTICSVAKLYGLISNGEDCNSGGAQPIVDYPFNTFTDDQFDLQVGQYLVVPGGVVQEQQLEQTIIAKQLTPNAGAVTANGQFIWPTQGVITQKFSWYHSGVDIANHIGTPILAADSGKIIVAGWTDNTGYGNRVMIDHGNGYITLYGHMSVISVQVGQTVHRGDVIGLMGSTGRSTGPHCHFEVRKGNVPQDPLAYLQ